jgi:CBS domain-containing protein
MLGAAHQRTPALPDLAAEAPSVVVRGGPKVTQGAGRGSLPKLVLHGQAEDKAQPGGEVDVMTLHAAWITGTVDDLYRPGAITATADDSLEQVAARLQGKDISALVILDGDRLVGIITERDIVRAVADRRDLADGIAGEYMTLAPATVGLETPLAEVARTMLAYGVRHLPVVVAGDVLGMVSARDLLELESATTP